MRDFSLEVPKGSVFGVLGPSGAGKSTFARLITGLETPDEGQVRVGGVDLARLKPAELRAVRARLGVVFQNFNLLAQRTAAGNVSLPLEFAGVPRYEREQRVAELLERVGLKGLEKRYPAQLSGGQRQRVGIARALAGHPDLLVADEATSALDPATAASILELLRDLQQQSGLTLVIITHQIEVVRSLCTHAAVLEAGQVAEVGPAADLLLRPRAQATRALLEAHRPQVPLEPGETLLRLSVRGDLDAALLRHLAQLELRIVQSHADTVGGVRVTELWLAVNGGEAAAARVRARLEAEVAA
nr:methionine ABC transporter ATP-binding protein [Deinobacterium chartae]